MPTKDYRKKGLKNKQVLSAVNKEISLAKRNLLESRVLWRAIAICPDVLARFQIKAFKYKMAPIAKSLRTLQTPCSLLPPCVYTYYSTAWNTPPSRSLVFKDSAQASHLEGCERLARSPISLSLSFLFCKMEITAPLQVTVKTHTAVGIADTHIHQMKQLAWLHV